MRKKNLLLIKYKSTIGAPFKANMVKFRPTYFFFTNPDPCKENHGIIFNVSQGYNKILWGIEGGGGGRIYGQWEKKERKV